MLQISLASTKMNAVSQKPDAGIAGACLLDFSIWSFAMTRCTLKGTLISCARIFSQTRAFASRSRYRAAAGKCGVTGNIVPLPRSTYVLVQVNTSSGDWVTVDPPASFRAKSVACSATRLDMFDKLAHTSDPQVLQGNSWLVQKVMNAADVQGFGVHDQLRELILCGEDSANNHLLSELEQQEFLWKIFCHLVLGGQLNQYEDDVDQYRQAAKSLYRTLIRYEHCPACPHASTKRLVHQQQLQAYQLQGQEGVC